MSSANTQEITDKPTDDAPTLVKLVCAQKNNVFCQTETYQVDRAIIEFTINSNGLLVRKSTLDGAIQIVIPQSHRRRIPMVSHHASTAGHPDQRRVYDKLSHHFSWHHMAGDVDHIVSRCKSGTKNNPKYRDRTKLQLFSASGTLDYVSKDIVGHFPETTQLWQYIIFMMDKNSKLVLAIQGFKRTATNVANIFFDHLLFPYGISAYIFTDNGTQFDRKCFATTCSLLCVKQLIRTAYHSQMRGQAKRFSKINLMRLRHYVEKH